MDVVHLALGNKVSDAIENKQVAEQQALEATYKAPAKKKNLALGGGKEARAQPGANRLKA